MSDVIKRVAAGSRGCAKIPLFISEYLAMTEPLNGLTKLDRRDKVVWSSDDVKSNVLKGIR